MSLQQVLLTNHLRLLFAYYQEELPHAAAAKVSADLRDRLLPSVEYCARHTVLSGGEDMWYEIAALCYRLLIQAASTDARPVAEIYADRLPEILTSNLSLGDKMCVYEMLKHLYSVSARDYPDLRVFDTKVARPFSDWLAIDAPPAPPPPSFAGRRLRIGYLCNYTAMMGPGKPAAPLFLSFILDHQQGLDHDLIVYAPGAPTPGWAALMVELGIPFTPLHFTGFAARGDIGLPQSLARIREDRLDVLLTDDNLALPTYLYERRAAAVQVFVPMQLTFWGIRQLDYAVIALQTAEESSDLPAARVITGRYCYNSRLLDRPVDGAALAAARARIPADHRVAGIFARFVKVSAEQVAVLGRLLDAHPNLTVVIGGTGDASLLQDFLAASPHVHRVLFHEHDLDIFIWGRVIDFLLDTFPFTSANSSREVQHFGKPVVSVRNPVFAQFFAESRDPELVAADAEDYCRIVGRLIQEPAWLAERGAAARRIGALDTQPGGNLPLLRELLARLGASS